MKRLLVNVLGEQEYRIAVVEDGRLVEYFLEEQDERSLVGSIYLGRVINIEPAIQAAFIDIGESRSSFLHVSDLHPAYAGARGIPFEEFLAEQPDDGPTPIQETLRRGQQILVQISKGPIGHKGPSATTYLSLPGRYVVVLIGLPRVGVSKRIEDPEQREMLRELGESLPPVDYAGIIVRTAGEGMRRADLLQDLQRLRELWRGIVQGCHSAKPPQLLHREPNLALRTIRDVYDSSIDEIIVDCAPAAAEIREYMGEWMAACCPRVKSWGGAQPLFSRHQIDRQIASLYDRRVALPSGGSLVIEETEALVAIDVNSGRSRQQSDLEATALQTNLEACEEIARQLRLRDLGGVIISDYIDMIELANRRRLEEEFAEHLKRDRAKVWWSRMSRFGIIELTRQRLGPSKQRLDREPCPTCRGRGRVRSSASVARSIVRELRRRSPRERAARGEGRSRRARPAR